MSVWWRTNMMHGFIIYKIKILFLYICNQTNTKPSWELSAWRTFPPPVAASISLTLGDAEWVGRWWSPVPPSGRGRGCWAPWTPEWPRTAAGWRHPWPTCWQNLLSENPRGTQLITHGKQSREGSKWSQSGAHLRNTRHSVWKVPGIIAG